MEKGRSSPARRQYDSTQEIPVSMVPSVSRWTCWMRKGIAYDYCPGVSAFCGAASALNLEYTLPDTAQSVIITRMEGRTPVPAKRRASSPLLHIGQPWWYSLSTGMLEELSRRLIEGGYTAEYTCSHRV